MASHPGKLRIALAQINTTVGEIDGNAARIAEAIESAQAAGAQLVVLPELAVPGYPPEDLLLKRHFLAANTRALEEIAEIDLEVRGIEGSRATLWRDHRRASGD